MKLARIARKYDTCPVFDGYSGASLFRVQASTFLESAVEGSTSSRRVISVAPEIVPPAHSVIMILDQLWLLGHSNPDEWEGTVIRKAYWSKLVTDNFRLLTPSQAVLGQTGVQVFGQKKFLRETINTATDSQLDPMWDISLSASLNCPRGYFLRSGTTLYRVRLEYKDTDGFLTCQSDQIDETPIPVSFTTNDTFDMVADKYVPNSVTVQGLPVDYAKLYTKQEQVDYAMVAGDLTLLVPKSLTLPKVGNQVEIHNSLRYADKWRVLNIRHDHDCYALHMRRA